jgi:hypothetical protein
MKTEDIGAAEAHGTPAGRRIAWPRTVGFGLGLGFDTVGEGVAPGCGLRYRACRRDPPTG